MKLKNNIVSHICFLLITCTYAIANNPLVPDVGMADPHIHIFEGKAYLYCTKDTDKNGQDWTMYEWHVWSSNDLIHWKHESQLKPEDTYIGKSINRCFATDCAEKDGRYYLYFSNSTEDTGVAVSGRPAGPFKDVLGKPMLPKGLSKTKEYDISVPIDNGIPYIIFGHNTTRHNVQYHIAKMNPDMISLTEKPHAIDIIGDITPNDKPNVHIYKNHYYLSSGANYAIADNIYGPYQVRRNEGDDTHPYGFNKRAHGNFFEWNNQWFYTWCRFIQSPKLKYRESYVTYVHYKENGDMVYDTELLDKHFAMGVGQYGANWSRIQAEWYMAADNCSKKESPDGGFEIQNTKDGSWLKYPNIQNMKSNSTIIFKCSSINGGLIEVHENTVNGNLLGSCRVASTGEWNQYKEFHCKLENNADQKDVVLVFKGKSNDLIHLDSFSFK